jgi:hypothetical protein
MANRYWVGGTDTWDATAGNKWSATDGGAGGATVPTSSDDVYINANLAPFVTRNTAYTVGAIVSNNITASRYFECTTAGTTGSSSPPTWNSSVGATTVDGTVVWTSRDGTITLGTTGVVNVIDFTGFSQTFDFGTNKIQVAYSSTATYNVFIARVTNVFTGTPLVELTGAQTSGIRRILTENVLESRSVSFNIVGGSGTSSVSFLTNSTVKSINTTGFSGSLVYTSMIVYGNLFIASTTTVTSATVTLTFSGTTGTQTITTNGVTIPTAISFNSTNPAAIFRLIDNLTTTSIRTTTLSQGVLDLNNNTLSTGVFSFTGSNVRSILFGTGSITCTGTSTVWSGTTLTNFTYTGTPTVNISNNTATAATIAHGSTGGSAANAVNFYITTGTYALGVTTNSVINTLDFTGFAGSWSPSSATLIFYNSLILSSTMAFTPNTGAFTFATTGTGVITAAGKTLGPIIQSGIGGTIQLGSAFTSNSSYTLTNGTLNFNNFNFTALTFAANTVTNARSLIMGSSTMYLTANGATTAFSIFATNFTLVPGTSTIDFSTTINNSVLTFAGAGLTYNNFTMSGSTGSISVIFTGANTFNTISSSKTVSYALIFPTTGTTNIATLSAQGTSGNLATFRSSTGLTNCTINITNSFNLSYVAFVDITLSSSNGNVSDSVLSVSSTGIAPVTNNQYFSVLSSGTAFTVPSTWTSTNSIHLFGGGGGGSGSTRGTVTSNRSGGAGGGGGGYTFVSNRTYSIGDTVFYTIGAGGSAGASSAAGATSTAGTGGTTRWEGTYNTISFVSSAFTQSNGTSSTFAVTVPTVSNGDLMIMTLQSSVNTNTWSTPTGWTLGTTGANGRALFWRIASSEPASYNVSQISTVPGNAFIVAYANAVFDKSGLASQTAASPITPVAVSADVADSTVLYLASTDSTANVTFTTPTGFTVVNTDSDATAPSASVFSIANIAAGSYSAPSTTPSSGNARAYIIILSPSLGYTITATGGTGGVSTAGLSSTGGSGGVGSGGSLSYTGGTGAIGGLNTSSLAAHGGGGGGAAGPNGNGAVGGAGTAGSTGAGGGGGGNGGGTAGASSAAGSTGGNGGNNSLGYGRGLGTTTVGGAGFAGGGGAGSGGFTGGNGGGGVEVFNAYGSGGGGGSSGAAVVPRTGGLFGGGGGGASQGTSTTTSYAGVVGAQGGIIVIWTIAGGGAAFTGSVTENSTLADVINILTSYNTNITENNTLLDPSIASIQYIFNITENNNPNDVVSVGFGYTAAITENTNLNDDELVGTAFDVNLTENTSLADFNALLASFFMSLTEGLVVNDLNTQISNFLVSLVENGTIQDTNNIQASFTQSIAENIDLDSLEQTINAFIDAVTEAITVDDLKTARSDFLASISENVDLADSNDVLGLLTENSTLADINSVKMDYIVAVFENVGLLDIICYNGWFKIDTSQPNVWNNINDSQSAGWSSVDTNQTPSWGNIDTSQPCS